VPLVYQQHISAPVARDFLWLPVTSTAGGAYPFNGYNWTAEYDTTKFYPPIKYAVPSSMMGGALGDLFQFEVHANDSSNIGSERAELNEYTFGLAQDTNWYISYAFKVLPGDNLGSAITSFNILGQMHKYVDQPTEHIDFHFWWIDESLYLNCTNLSRFPPNGTLYQSGVLPRNQWHNVFLVFNKTTANPPVADVLQCWLNGVQVANVTTGALYTNLGGANTGGQSAWKFGIYRGPQTTTPLPIEVVQYANMELTSTNISARIANPLPWPVPK